MKDIAKIHDITPKHEPVALLRCLEEDAKESVAAFVVLLKEDDEIQYEGVGVCAKDLLWAIEKMKLKLLGAIE